MPDGSVTVCAHRGNSSEFPENTLPAFRSAVELQVDMVEFDVCSTRDGQCVICHDHTVDRTTGGTGRLDALALAEIRELDAGSWRGDQFVGTRMPTLAEALDAMPAAVRLNIHIKSHSPDMSRLVGHVIAEIRERALFDTAFIASEEAEIRFVRRLEPRIRTCCLSGQTGESYIDYSHSLGCAILQPGHQITTPEFVRRAHDRGMAVNVFYADEVPEMQRLVDCGVDGILTNYPKRLLTLIGRLR